MARVFVELLRLNTSRVAGARDSDLLEQKKALERELEEKEKQMRQVALASEQQQQQQQRQLAQLQTQLAEMQKLAASRAQQAAPVAVPQYGAPAQPVHYGAVPQAPQDYYHQQAAQQQPPQPYGGAYQVRVRVPWNHPLPTHLGRARSSTPHTAAQVALPTGLSKHTGTSKRNSPLATACLATAPRATVRPATAAVAVAALAPHPRAALATGTAPSVAPLCLRPKPTASSATRTARCRLALPSRRRRARSCAVLAIGTAARAGLSCSRRVPRVFAVACHRALRRVRAAAEVPAAAIPPWVVVAWAAPRAARATGTAPAAAQWCLPSNRRASSVAAPSEGE